MENGKAKKIIGIVLFAAIISGLTCCEDNYKLNHSDRNGNIIEQTIEEIDFDSVFNSVDNINFRGK